MQETVDECVAAALLLFFFFFLSSHEACGILVRDQGLNSCSLQWSLYQCTSRETPVCASGAGSCVSTDASGMVG